MDSVAVVLLAGGQARRFPHKLEHVVDGRAMLARCYERVRAAGWPIYIAGKGTFPSSLDAQIDAPLLIDRRPGGGPLQAFVDACVTIRAQRLFAVAADQPQLDTPLLRGLADLWQTGDEAVVPRHDGAIEPLAALYDRGAVLREAFAMRATRKNAMHDLIARLAARFVTCDPRHFCNVNRFEDLPAN
jgi:molybdenum cofactor guanylyltransferase